MIHCEKGVIWKWNIPQEKLQDAPVPSWRRVQKASLLDQRSNSGLVFAVCP